jgi:2-(1,2-epoxy-1,2-dihydrophenyl)acetyl-CoA isomerase
MPKPTIAALPGAAAGAGLSLALACDLRYAVEGAVLTTAFARVAFAGDYGGTWFLTRLVGSGKARELYYFSERLSAEEAAQLGIVNAVFPRDTFEQEVMALARRLAAGPRTAYRYMKENLNRAVHGELGECLDIEVTHHIHTGQTEDHREAARAFVEKREPRFQGR